MTYYEELGISPRASEAEVKRSYKRLTLLLHPDQQQDPEIKALADAQMKRLNEIIAILLDPEQRRNYDMEILGQLLTVRHPELRPPLIWFRNSGGWILVTGASFLFLGAALLIPDFDSSRQPAPVKAQWPARQAKPAIEPAIRINPSARRVDARVLPRPPQAQRRSESTFLKAEAAPEPPDAVRPPSITMSALALPAPITPLFEPPGIATQAAPEASALAGKWVFTPDPMDRLDPNRFPAEYVELSIVETDGRLRGSYRSRYKLPDHSLSPFVKFTFEGASGAASFDWRGDGGAQGEITLRLQSHDKLDASWFATKMGSELSLGSGSATVFRFR